MMGYVIIFIILLIAIYFFATYNDLIRKKNIVNEAFSTMDVYLKKRWDLVPNLVEVVKGYANYEKETFYKITELRARSYDAMIINNKVEINEELAKEISKLLIVSENYPELKANQNFIELSKNLTQIEDEIANSRKYYNGAVRMLNNKIQMFPSNIVAGICGLKMVSMFNIVEEEKENKNIQL